MQPEKVDRTLSWTRTAWFCRTSRTRASLGGALLVAPCTPSRTAHMRRRARIDLGRYGQSSAMLALVPMLDVHWALVLPLNESVTLPPLKELTVMPDCGHLFVQAT